MNSFGMDRYEREQLALFLECQTPDNAFWDVLRRRTPKKEKRKKQPERIRSPKQIAETM